MKLLCLLIIFSGLSFAQDERFFRRIFTDELQPKKKSIDFKVKVSTPNYMVDLNRDGVDERISVAKKDGLDFFQIKDARGRTIMEEKLRAKGVNSVLYKIRLISISPSTDVALLFFDEGESGTAVFQSTARLYMVAIDGGDLDKARLFRGPAFFYEKEKPVDQYSRRYYNVSVADFNKDGVKEVAVAYNKIQRIYFYLGKGRWDKL